jgi:predicted nucleotidyltransferase
MSISESERQRILENWTKRREHHQEKQTALREGALQCAHKIAAFLRDHYSVDQVHLYGSLARDGHFDALSDIDMMITGWKPHHRYFRMLAEVQDIARPYEVSVLLKEDALPEILETIQKEGKLL